MSPQATAGWRYRLALLAIPLAGLIFVALLDGYYRSELRLQQRQQLTEAVADARDQLAYSMEMRIRAVEELKTFLLAIGDPTDFATFDRIGRNLQARNPALETLMFIDSGLVVRHVYPRQEGAVAVGTYVGDHSAADAIRDAIGERKLVVDDPRTTRSGQIAVVVRTPLFAEDEFIGLVEGRFVVPELVKLDLGYLMDRFDIQLRDRNGEVFWGAASVDSSNAETEVIEFADNTWVLTMGGHTAAGGPILFVRGVIWVGGLLAIVLLMFGVDRTSRHRLRLETAVAEKTQQLRRRNAQLEHQINEREEAEESLRQSQVRLNEAQRIANMGSWEWDLQSGRFTWSDELFRLCGSEPHAVRPGYETFLGCVHPEDRDELHARIEAAKRNGESFEAEYRILWEDGTVRHMKGRVRVMFDEEGEGERMIGIAQDVTDKKLAEFALQESERKYRALLESASDGIAIANLEGGLIEGNRRLQEWLGYSERELLNLSVLALTPDEHDAGVETALASIREHGHSLTEHLIRRKDGSTFPVEVAGTRIELGGHQVAMGIFRDITERKRLEAALHRHREELEELVSKRTEELTVANRELEAFSYSVSHDLRGPLRAINGFSHALREDCGAALDELAHDYIERICAATQRMGQLIDDLLQLSRTMRAELQQQPIAISAMAEEVVAELRAGAPEREVEFSAEPDLTAFGDPTLLRALLDNLIGNAWKFTRERRPADIAFGRTERGGEPAFYVRDNGIGLDMAYASKLFQPFQRLHAQNEYDGSGIGLANVQRIVQRHGGKVWVESEVDRGSTFFFTLGAEAAVVPDASRAAG